jgi:hypothetical protein
MLSQKRYYILSAKTHSSQDECFLQDTYRRIHPASPFLLLTLISRRTGSDIIPSSPSYSIPQLSCTSLLSSFSTLYGYSGAPRFRCLSECEAHPLHGKQVEKQSETFHLCRDARGFLTQIGVLNTIPATVFLIHHGCMVQRYMPSCCAIQM